jgi:hypothetical protein
MKQGVSMEDTGAARFPNQIQLFTEKTPGTGNGSSSPLEGAGSRGASSPPARSPT